MNELICIKEASKLLGVKESWLRKVIFKKEIPIVKLKRLVRFRRCDLEEYVKKNIQQENQGGL